MSELLTPYWNAFKRSALLIIIISGLVGLIGYGLAARAEPEYQVHFSYVVSLQEREEKNEYTFDGYYALQATDLFTSTVAQWLTTPEIIVQAYQRVGIQLPSTDPYAVVKLVRSEKTAPQLIEVTVRHRDRDVAQQLTRGLQEVLADNIAAYHRDGIPALTFRVVPTMAWTGARQFGSSVIGIALFGITFVIATNVVLFRESLKH